MSHVTDIILIDSGLHLHEVREINKYLQDNYNSGLQQIDSMFGGGNKAIQCDIWIGAYNHMDIDLFLNFFYSLRCVFKKEVQLLLKDEHDECFTLYEREG